VSDTKARDAGDDVSDTSASYPDPDAERLLNPAIPHRKEDHGHGLDRCFENTKEEPCGCQAREVVSSGMADEHDAPDDDLPIVSLLSL